MYKVCLKLVAAGAGLLVAGAILLFTAVALGFPSDRVSLPHIGEFSSDEWAGLAATTVLAEERVSKPVALETPLNGIDVECSIGRFYVTGGGEPLIETSGIREEYFEYYVEDGVLHVKYSPRFRSLSDLWLFDDFGDIWITVPDDVLSIAEFKVDAGELNVSRLWADELEVDMSAGYANFSNVNANSKAEIDISAGEVSYDNGVLNNLDCELSAGALSFYACEITNGAFNLSAGDVYASETVITGASKVDMSAGSVVMNLNGALSHYAFKTSRTAGKISINGTDAAELTNNAAPHSFDIKITAGSCEINIY
jgi:hypothetical protein